MVSNNASTPAFDRRANRKQIAVPAVENEGETLMCNSEETCSSRDAAARLFEGAADQVTFVSKHFRV